MVLVQLDKQTFLEKEECITLGCGFLAALDYLLVYVVFLCLTSHVLFKSKSVEERVSVSTFPECKSCLGKFNVNLER